MIVPTTAVWSAGLALSADCVQLIVVQGVGPFLPTLGQTEPRSVAVADVDQPFAVAFARQIPEMADSFHPALSRKCLVRPTSHAVLCCPASPDRHVVLMVVYVRVPVEIRSFGPLVHFPDERFGPVHCPNKSQPHVNHVSRRARTRLIYLLTPSIALFMSYVIREIRAAHSCSYSERAVWSVHFPDVG